LNAHKKINPGKIIVFCPNWVGDAVMATPAFDCLRQNFPDAHITALIRAYARGVIDDGPWFDRIIECTDKTITGYFSLIGTLRRLKPDMAIVLPNSIRSALIARLGGTPKIYGYGREGRSILLSSGPKPHRGPTGILPVPMQAYYLEICRWLNLKIPESTEPRLFFSEQLRTKCDSLLAKWGILPHDMVIGLNPGAKFGSSKCWPPHYFASLADMLNARWNCKILLLIGPGEAQLGQRIVQLSHTEVINTGPERIDLSLLKPLIKRCQLLVTNDTGPRHYAVAFEVPVVVIMGPTDPRYTDTNLKKTLVLRQDLDCSPCHAKVCPRDHECMAEIAPHAVLASSEQLMQESV